MHILDHIERALRPLNQRIHHRQARRWLGHVRWIRFVALVILALAFTWRYYAG